jgi:hypothetical protein
LKEFKEKQRREAEPHRRSPQKRVPWSAEPPPRVAARDVSGGEPPPVAQPPNTQPNAGSPWQGGRRPDRRGAPGNRAELARPKDTGRDGA